MKGLRTRYSCPVELSLEFVGGKWKTVILAWLKEAPRRYGELRALMPGISDKVLSERLRDLQSLGLVVKAGGDVAPIYRLSARGDSLRPILDALYYWGDAAARELPVTIAAQGPVAARRARRGNDL